MYAIRSYYDFRLALEKIEICDHGAYVYMGKVENRNNFV